MPPSLTLVFDFDGVLVDGMEEYWSSAREAAIGLRSDFTLPEEVPAAFRRLRPRVHKGWEMVLLALLLASHPEGLEEQVGSDPQWGIQLLPDWAGGPGSLQQTLETARELAIASDPDRWLARHHFYPGVVRRLQGLRAEGVAWGVLTTKAERFTRQILDSRQLAPSWVIGHERGSKAEVLKVLQQQSHQQVWLIEDRRETLEAVRAAPELASVRCYLASWGYLKPEDSIGLPEDIQLLKPEEFVAPLAGWP